MSAPVVRVPADVVGLRLWLADQWKPGRHFATTVAPMLASRGYGVMGVQPEVESYVRHERTTLEAAQLWWVGTEMVDLLEATYPGVPDDVMVASLPAPSPRGLVVFARSLVLTDATLVDATVTVDAIAWGSCTVPTISGGERRPAVSMAAYRCIDFAKLNRAELDAFSDDNGAMLRAFAKPTEVGRWTSDGTVEWAPQWQPSAEMLQRSLSDGSRPAGEPVMTLLGRTWVPLGRSDWPRTDQLASAPWPDMAPQAVSSFIEDRRVIAALWTLVHSAGIAATEVEPATRQARRAASRAGVTDSSDVVVITLRRPKSDPGDPTGEHRARYSHRWIVDGHWRHQACGPQRSLRRLVFIAPHVKGPADTPLVVKPRVRAWVR